MGLTAGGEAASTFPVTKMSCWDNCWGIFYSDCHKGPPSPVWIPHRLEGITIYTENFHLHFSGDWLLTSHCFTEAQSLLFEPSKRIPFSPLALPGAPGNVLMLGSFECLELRGNQALEGNYCSAQLKEENILQTKTRTFQPRSGTRDLGGRTQDDKATQYMRCTLQCLFQAEHLGKGEGLLCHQCIL